VSVKADCIRLRVFKIWFLTLAVILTVYALKILGIQGEPHPFSRLFESLEMMLGLVLPQIGVMAAFYLNFDEHDDRLESVSQSQLSVITWLSVSYHVIFIATFIAGVGLHRLDATSDGDSLMRNTAHVMGIMGIFSVFLAPVVFLFTRARRDDELGAG
jgi:hypothetical protein